MPWGCLTEYVRNVAVLLSDWIGETDQDKFLKRGLDSLIPFVHTRDPYATFPDVLADKPPERCEIQKMALMRRIILISSDFASPSAFNYALCSTFFTPPFTDFTPLQNIYILTNVFANHTIPCGAFQPLKQEKISRTLKRLGIVMSPGEIAMRIDSLRYQLPISCSRDEIVVRDSIFWLNTD